MVKARTWLALVLISFGTLAATVSCGSDEATGGSPGGVLIMGGAGGGGNGGAAGKGGAVNRGGSGGTASTVVGALGQTCTADLDCGAGLVCVLPTDPALGPANGLCTMACQNNGQCDAVSPGAGCVDFGGSEAYCLEGCEQGAPIDLTTKCHGRPDEACGEFTSGTGATATSIFLCRPLCRADAECGTGLYCDTGSGSCTKTKPTGDPVGAPCDPAAALAGTNTCKGICLSTTSAGVVPAKGVCVDICSGLTECMYTGTTPGGFCVGALTQAFDVLDLGFCEPSCGCTSDCQIPDEVCQAWVPAAATIQADLGSDGFCYPNALGSTELTCGAAGAGNTPAPSGDTAGASGN